MEKVFHFDSPQPVYTADACVISCYDARFDLVVRKFLKRRGIEAYDHLKIAGSVKWLADPVSPTDRDFVLRMVQISVRLHNPQRVLIFAHNECGAYEGAPPEAVTADLLRAASVISETMPALGIESYFADFDGIYAVR